MHRRRVASGSERAKLDRFSQWERMCRIAVGYIFDVRRSVINVEETGVEWYLQRKIRGAIAHSSG